MIPLCAIADPWQDSRDLESLHAEASDAVIRAVEQLRASTRQAANRPLPLAILGTAGIGKTHLFGRLRRRLDRRAVLVHIRPLVSAPITPRHLLRQVMEQLSFRNGDAPQVDTLVNGLITLHLEGDPACPSQGYDLLRTLDPVGRTRYLEDLLEKLVTRHPDVDDGVLHHLLHLPFLAPLPRKATQAWLGGADLHEAQYARIGERAPLAEERLLPALLTLARVAAPVAPLVLVFDQLENLVTGEAGGIHAYGNLLSELTDTVQDLVLVQMALDSEWTAHIRPALSLSQRDRLEGGGTCVLALPTPSQRRSLVELWTQGETMDLPWNRLRPILEGPGVTPRMVAGALKAALEGGVDAEQDAERLEERLQEAWEARLAQVRRDLDRLDQEGQGPAPAFYRDALLQFIQLLGLGARIQDRDLVALGSQCLLLISGVQHRSVGAELKRAEALPTPLLLLREQWRPFPPTWKLTLQQATRLEARPGVRWHWLCRDDAARLLAFDAFCKDARSGDLAHPDGRALSLDEATTWLRQGLDPRTWPLGEALLGTDPREDDAGAPPSEPLAHPAPASPSRLRDVLERLQVASLDRLLREGAAPTRAQLLQGLRDLGPRVRWLGASLVCLARTPEVRP